MNSTIEPPPSLDTPFILIFFAYAYLGISFYVIPGIQAICAISNQFSDEERESPGTPIQTTDLTTGATGTEEGGGTANSATIVMI